MTGTMTTRDQRADRDRRDDGHRPRRADVGRELRARQPADAVQSRLSALRGGALRRRSPRSRCSLDGGAVTDGALAVGARRRRAPRGLRAPSRRPPRLRLYAGLDARRRAGRGARRRAGAQARPPLGLLRQRPPDPRRPRRRARTRPASTSTRVGVTVGVDRAVGRQLLLRRRRSRRSTTRPSSTAPAASSTSRRPRAHPLRHLGGGRARLLPGHRAPTGRTSYDQRRAGSSCRSSARSPRAPSSTATSSPARSRGGWAWDGPRGTATLFGRGSCGAREGRRLPRDRRGRRRCPGTPFTADFGIAVDEQELDVAARRVRPRPVARLPFSGGICRAAGQRLLPARVRRRRPAQSAASFLGDSRRRLVLRAVHATTPTATASTSAASLRFQFLWGSLFVAYDQELERDDLDLATCQRPDCGSSSEPGDRARPT